MFQPHGADRFPAAQLTPEDKNEIRGILAALAIRAQKQAGALALLLRPATSISPLALQESPLGRALLFLADVSEHGLLGRPISAEQVARALDLVSEVVLRHPLSGEPVHAGLLDDSLLGGIIGRCRLLLDPSDAFVPLAEAASLLDCTPQALEHLAHTGRVPALFVPGRGLGMLRSALCAVHAEWYGAPDDPETEREHPHSDTQALQAGREDTEQPSATSTLQKRPRGRPVGTTKKKPAKKEGAAL
jgi:hypothetical protein